MKILLTALLLCITIPSALGEDEKKGRPVDPAALAILLKSGNRVVVMNSPRKSEAKVLFESRNKKDVEALSSALSIKKPEEWFHCMCDGTPAIFVFDGEKELVRITNHHGVSLRCSLWASDAPIVDTEKWLKWFDDRKIPGPRIEVEEMRANRKQGERDWKRWVAAIPKGLEPIWENAIGELFDVDTKPLVKALETSIPNKEDQILAILEWFGSGAGPWSGCPSYELVAEELLLEYQVAEIVSVIDIEKLTASQIEGAARLFGGWDFSQKYPEGLKQVPPEIKKALWDHVKDTKDDDKLGRAENAFKPKG